MADESLSWLDKYFGPPTIEQNGVAVTQRTTLNFQGSDVAIADDPVNKRTNITLSGGGAPILNAGTGTLNDVATTTSGTPTSTVRFSGVAPSVTGFSSGTPGRKVVLEATGGPLVLQNESTSSAVSNRIITGTGGLLTIPQDAVAMIVYDDTSLRWRVLAVTTTTSEASPITNSGTGTLNDITSTVSGSPSPTIRFTGVAPSVTGIASGAANRKIVLMATAGPLVLKNDNASSSAANRILTGTGSDATVSNGETVIVAFDATSSRWRLVKASGGGSGTPGGATDSIQYKIDGNTFGGLEGWGRKAYGRKHLEAHDVVSAPNLTFAAAGQTITRDFGSFVTDGFVDGEQIRIRGTAANDGLRTIVTATATVLTLASGVANESPISGTCWIESLGHLSVGRAGSTYPDVGAIRGEQLPSGAPSRVLMSAVDGSGNVVPIISYTRALEVLCGGTLEDANDSNGVTVKRPVSWIFWGINFLNRCEAQSWQDDANTTFERKFRGKLATANATPTPIPLQGSITLSGSANQVPTVTAKVTARSSTEWAVFWFEGTTLVKERKSVGASSWACTFDGTTFTATGAVANITWILTGEYVP